MSDLAEMQVNGVVCDRCGDWMDDFGKPGQPRKCAACSPPPPVRKMHPDKPIPRRPTHPNEFFVTSKNTDAAFKALKFWLKDRAFKTFTASEDANRFYVDLYDDAEKSAGRINCFNNGAQHQAMRVIDKHMKNGVKAK